MPIKHFIDTLMSCTRVCFLLPVQPAIASPNGLLLAGARVCVVE